MDKINELTIKIKKVKADLNRNFSAGTEIHMMDALKRWKAELVEAITERQNELYSELSELDKIEAEVA